MSVLGNVYAQSLENAFMQVISNYLKSNYREYNSISVVNTAGDNDQYSSVENVDPINPAQALVLNLPRVACSAISQEEAVYQSGIYQTKFEVIVRADLDSQGYSMANGFYAAVLDSVQQLALVSQLNNAVDNDNQKLVLVKGIVLLNQQLNQTADRMYIRTIELDVFGMSSFAP